MGVPSIRRGGVVQGELQRARNLKCRRPDSAWGELGPSHETGLPGSPLPSHSCCRLLGILFVLALGPCCSEPRLIPLLPLGEWQELVDFAPQRLSDRLLPGSPARALGSGALGVVFRLEPGLRLCPSSRGPHEEQPQ